MAIASVDAALRCIATIGGVIVAPLSWMLSYRPMVFQDSTHIETAPGLADEPPLFSIIVPLEFHRGQWEYCWRGWMSQTFDKSRYEIILVVPPDFPHLEELVGLAGDDARLEFSDARHDIGLCAFGATVARGKYLFFTESHCLPESNVLELCLRAIADHPDWAGFSCKSVPICHNRLSEAEADMYQADIDFGMNIHPWLKVLDQCFVTRRDVYEACGGLREELGHFAEWALAAAYHARGHVIGYFTEARFHHYYIGKLGELKVFTLDFVEGEIRYLAGESHGVGDNLIDPPVEWFCQDDYDRDLARAALHALVLDSSVGRSWSRPGDKWRAFWRWGGRAVFGDHLARVIGRVSALGARCVLSILLLTGSRTSITRWLKHYIAALIHVQRLGCIHVARRASQVTGPRSGDRVLAQAGFHAPETSHGQPFRWSEPVAAVRIEGMPGRNMIRIRCLDMRGPLGRVRPRFYLEGVRVADCAITVACDSFLLCLDLPSGTARLAWVCSRLIANHDRRRLGLPIAAIEVGLLSGDRDEANGATLVARTGRPRSVSASVEQIASLAPLSGE